MHAHARRVVTVLAKVGISTITIALQLQNRRCQELQWSQRLPQMPQISMEMDDTKYALCPEFEH